MEEKRIFTSTASIVVIICITSVNCIGYSTFESRIVGLDEKQKDVEYDESHMIHVRCGNSIINNTLTADGQYGNIEIVIHAFREAFILKLKLNRHLFASSYFEKSMTHSSIIYHSINHTEDHCYYIGTVEDKDESTAAVSTCRGITGYYAIRNFSYHIEPLSNVINGPHKIYRIKENSHLLNGCGSEDNGFNSRFRVPSDSRRHKRSFMWPQDGDHRDKVLELYIASDNSQFVDKGRDAVAVFRRAKNIANFASSLYQALGIYFVLVGMEVWTDVDKFRISSSDVDTSLHSWYNYRMQNINPYHYNDNAILITRVEFYNQVIGKAIIGSICSNQYSGAVIVDKSSSGAAAGSTMAHEIGHNFGLQHDSQSCSCPDRDSKCIMYPTASANTATNWSDCSIDQFNKGFNQGLDICLYDVPHILYEKTVSTCGNGIIENDEQCDCGKSPKAECNSACCNATTCQLENSASCASGRCCDTARCQIFEADHLCRRNVSTCDLPEYCNGVLSTCPEDTYRPDGTNCTINGDFAHCYSGNCRSHRSQCELIWGEGTSSSSPICYQRFNILGYHYGNCGLKWFPNITYIPCESSDTMCGKLLCDTSTDQQLAYYQNYFLRSSASINGLACNSVIFDFGLRIQDPGLVPNGASCGIGKMCVSQKCIDISSLSRKFCNSLCFNNEECNNLGLCQSVIGPSRNQDIREGPHVGLIVGLCMLFIVILPVVVLGGICGYIYRQQLTECFHKDWLKKSDINSSDIPPLPCVLQTVQSQMPVDDGSHPPRKFDNGTQASSLSNMLPRLSNSIKPTRTAPRPPTKQTFPPTSQNQCPTNLGSNYHAHVTGNEHNDQHEKILWNLPNSRNHWAKNDAGQKPVVPSKPSVFVISENRPTPPPKPSFAANSRTPHAMT